MEPNLVALPAQIYRVCRGSDPLRLTGWDYIRQSERGRWDDTEDEYRVLYCSSSEVGALVEVLQDLRQSRAALDLLSQIKGKDEPPPEPMTLVKDRLRNRWTATLIPRHAEELVVYIEHGATRTFIERSVPECLSERGIVALKVGDAVGSDRSLSRIVSRLLFERGYNGVQAQSAEHRDSNTIAVFETQPVSGVLRVSLIPSLVQLSIDRPEPALAAAQFLDIAPQI